MEIELFYPEVGIDAFQKRLDFITNIKDKPLEDIIEEDSWITIDKDNIRDLKENRLMDRIHDDIAYFGMSKDHLYWKAETASVKNFTQYES